MRFSIFKTCLIVFCVLGPTLGHLSPSYSGQKIQVSEAFSALMHQTEETYLSKRGLTFVNILDKDPAAGARLLGLGMMSQVDHSKKSETDRQKYITLSAEIKNFLRQLATIHQKSPNGVRSTTFELLWEAFRQGFTGKSNSWAMTNFGKNPFEVRQPSVLHLAAGPSIQLPEKRSKIPMDVVNTGLLILLGQIADPVAGERPANQPPPPPPASQESKYRWRVLGIYQNLTWWDGSYKSCSSFGNPEKPVISFITECCDSTKGCPGRDQAKVVPCRAVRGNCVMKVELLKNSHLGKKGETKCILLY